MSLLECPSLSRTDRLQMRNQVSAPVPVPFQTSLRVHGEDHLCWPARMRLVSPSPLLSLSLSIFSFCSLYSLHVAIEIVHVRTKLSSCSMLSNCATYTICNGLSMYTTIVVVLLPSPNSITCPMFEIPQFGRSVDSDRLKWRTTPSHLCKLPPNFRVFSRLNSTIIAVRIRSRRRG